MTELIENKAMVSFVPLDIEESRSMAYCIGLADKANGFVSSYIYENNPVEKRIDYSAIL